MWTDFYALSNIVQALLAGALAAVLVGLYREHHRAYLKLWAAGWWASAVGNLAGAATVGLGLGASARHSWVFALIGAAELVQAGALLLGALAYAYRGRGPTRDAEKLWLAACAATGALLGAGPLGSVLGLLRSTLLPALAGLAFVATAALFLKTRNRRGSIAGAVVLTALAAFGTVKLLYPFLLVVEQSPAHGAAAAGLARSLVAVDSLLQSVVDVAMLVWLLLEERTRVESVSGELRRVTRTDALTRLPNREAFVALLEAALPRAGAEGRSLALFSVDLDRFKQFNLALGEGLGDELLREMARRLRAAAPPRAGLARLRSDEFAVLVPDPGPPAHVDALAARLLQAMRAPLRLRDEELHVTASLGIALYPAHATTAAELLNNAGLAHQLATSEGGDRAQLYAAALGETARSRSSLTLALHRALEEREFVLYFQPIFSVASGGIEAFEALLRWRRPDGSVVGPGEFLPLCTAAGIADQVDDFVLRTACAMARRLRDKDPHLCMAVNLSAPFFHQPGAVDRVRAALEAARLPAEALELEITETAAMSDAEATLRVLLELKRLGVRLAIDDFGTGYSSLSYLHRFPVDTLKIDQSFVRAISADPGALAIVDGILALSRSLRLNVIAEGVESEAQLSMLRGLRCDQVQGFALGRPLPPEECLAALQANALKAVR